VSGQPTHSVAQLDELSVAQAIVDVALRHAGPRRVVGIEVRVGESSEVVPACLEFAFALLTPGTALDGTALTLIPSAGADLVIDAITLESEPATNWLHRRSRV
jgi:hypothetical protein